MRRICRKQNEVEFANVANPQWTLRRSLTAEDERNMTGSVKQPSSQLTSVFDKGDAGMIQRIAKLRLLIQSNPVSIIPSFRLWRGET
jgi:hypothetical protein